MKRYRRNAEEISRRTESWRKLTPQQQLDHLDQRLGRGVGATKQRARLQLLIEKAKGVPTTK